MPKVNVVIVDDHPHGREGMRDILSLDTRFHIVGEAVNGEQAIQLANQHQPDLILMDINMPKLSGLAATQQIKTMYPLIKIVMVTVSDDIADLFEALKRGAQGYLLKNLSPSSWLEYLHGIMDDAAPMSRDVAFQLMREFKGANQGRASQATASSELGHTSLTEREFDILECVAQGHSNKKIAELLSISEHTVKNHLKNILQKLHLNNRVQLARYAMEHQLFGQ